MMLDGAGRPLLQKKQGRDPGIEAKPSGRAVHMPRVMRGGLKEMAERLYIESQPRPQPREPMVLGQKPKKPKVSKAEQKRAGAARQKLENLGKT